MQAWPVEAVSPEIVLWAHLEALTVLSFCPDCSRLCLSHLFQDACLTALTPWMTPVLTAISLSSHSTGLAVVFVPQSIYVR